MAAIEFYKLWSNIRARCTNTDLPSYKNYGGRGIVMHQAWLSSPAKFAAYIQRALGPRPSKLHSIDRINNDRGYVPGNLRWATRRQQNRNQRRTLLFSYKGETRSLADWADILNLPYQILWKRIYAGWDLDRAFNALVASTSHPGKFDIADYLAFCRNNPSGRNTVLEYFAYRERHPK